MRRSIRPVTLRRVIEVASLAVTNGKINQNTITNALNTTERRAKEILLELQRMKALEIQEAFYLATPITEAIIKAYETEDWKQLHKILYENYEFYNVFVNFILEDALTKDEILTKLSEHTKLIFNKTAIDTLCDWAERLGQVQRNLYNNRYYPLREEHLGLDLFISVTERCYQNLNTELRPGLKLVYVEIARLREDVCEKLGISRDVFDDLFRAMFRKFIGKIELCGAPLTTSAKHSPSSLRTMKKGEKHLILSPTFVTTREGKGVELDGKLYHYIAIFDPLKGGE